MAIYKTDFQAFSDSLVAISLPSIYRDSHENNNQTTEMSFQRVPYLIRDGTQRKGWRVLARRVKPEYDKRAYIVIENAIEIEEGHLPLMPLDYLLRKVVICFATAVQNNIRPSGIEGHPFVVNLP